MISEPSETHRIVICLATETPLLEGVGQVSIAAHFIIVRDSEAFVFRIPHFQRNNQDEQELETSCCTF